MPAHLDLVVGGVLTLAGWTGLVFAVLHARRVVDELTAPPSTGPEDCVEESTGHE